MTTFGIALYESNLSTEQEHAVVMAATEKTKEILESIDRLVAEEQNKERLAEIQVSLEAQRIKQGFGSVFICYGSGSGSSILG
jgi:hypothetical protein